eukprot:CAMPEP_0195273004 /NCGR_PEP_ID=MMETSP0706-20130129/16178_1 /TAXON_ID=33640 /ORGANISM="Asterionellopsis glacialis, Strain CCMP134" /LENGTH=57 /DNA_ID=CAMNT_0040329365 /DNA_START=18 /DNA_END=187 /DNA_ORIENTATION=-
MRGVHAKDGFAYGSQGAGELIDITVRRHVTRFKMDLGNAFVVPFDKPKENLGIDPAG